MAIRAARLLSRAGGALALGWLLGVAAAQAQPGDTTGSAASAPQPAYTDQYFTDQSRVPELVYSEAPHDESGGLFRALQFDAIGAFLNNSAGAQTSRIVEGGLTGSGQWDTLAWGSWSARAAQQTGGSDDFNSVARNQGGRGVLSVFGRQIAFGEQWSAAVGLGDIGSPGLALLQRSARLFLPMPVYAGLSTEWSGPHATQIVAGIGEPELQEGLLVPRVQTLGGQLATLGAQTDLGANWKLGGQMIAGHDLLADNFYYAPGSALLPAPITTATLVAALGWQGSGARSQLNLLDGHTQGGAGGGGAWWDASLGQDRLLQNFGLLRIDPGIRWGNQLLVSDAQGGYYHFSLRRARWQIDSGLDYIASVSGTGTNTGYATFNGRYAAFSDLSFGGTLNLRRSAGAQAWALSAYTELSDAAAATRVQLDAARDGGAGNLGLLLDRQWPAPNGAHLNTSIGVDRVTNDASPAGNLTLLALAAYGGGSFGRLSLDANGRIARALQGSTAPSLQLNLSASWRWSARWSLRANVYATHLGAWRSIEVQSPLSPPVGVDVPAADATGMFLTIRYERSGGAHFAPLAGGPGSGWGALAGSVYLDANDNDRRDGGEAGVPNLTVVLDGRYSVQTDASGHFEFPAVASGAHRIKVVVDNLPLPWMLPDDGQREVQVSTRGRTELNIAARRPR